MKFLMYWQIEITYMNMFRILDMKSCMGNRKSKTLNMFKICNFFFGIDLGDGSMKQ